jgi:cyclic pyranopterin phosphate synthase
MSTNATRLRTLAQPLRAAGIRRINVSLDSLDPERYRALTGGGKLDKVLQGLEAAKAAGLAPIKINMVVLRDRNDDEVEAMVRFCLEQAFTLRFIEPMPMGDPGRAAGRDWIDLREIRQRLQERHDLVPALMPHGGPARYARVRGTDLLIGFITPLSQHFCATCNRVRLAVDGTLYLCLGQEDKLELRPLLRRQVSDAQLEQAIREAIARKPERHYFREQPEQLLRFMARTGG